VSLFVDGNYRKAMLNFRLMCGECSAFFLDSFLVFDGGGFQPPILGVLWVLEQKIDTQVF